MLRALAMFTTACTMQEEPSARAKMSGNSRFFGLRRSERPPMPMRASVRSRTG
jgi:hypothetical protein